MLAVTGKAPGTRPGGIITPNQHYAPINDFGTADTADVCVESRDRPLECIRRESVAA